MAACKVLTTGRDLPCPAPGGVKEFFLLDSSVAYTVDPTNRTITDFDDGEETPGAATVYGYHIKSATKVLETLTTVPENRSGAVVNQAFTGILHGLDYVTNNELLLIAYGQVRIIAHLYNGNSLLLGREFGCNLDTAEADSGSGVTEFNGYTLNVSAQELEFGNYLVGSTKEDPFAGMITPPTIFTPNTAPGENPVV